MAKERMTLLEALRKVGMDGEVDFLKEAVKAQAEAMTELEVKERAGADCTSAAMSV